MALIKQILVFLCIAYAQAPLLCMIHSNSVVFATNQLFNCAEQGNDPGLISICVEHGGNVFATNKNGQTPLDVADSWLNYWKHQQNLPAKKRTPIKQSTDLQKKIRHQERIVRELRNVQRERTNKVASEKISYNPLLILCSCALTKEKDGCEAIDAVKECPQKALHNLSKKRSLPTEQDPFEKKQCQPSTPSATSSHDSLEQRRKISLTVVIPPQETVLIKPL